MSRSLSLHQYWDAAHKWAVRHGTGVAAARRDPEFKQTYREYRGLSKQAGRLYEARETAADRRRWMEFAEEYREVLEELELNERPDIDWGS